MSDKWRALGVLGASLSQWGQSYNKRQSEDADRLLKQEELKYERERNKRLDALKTREVAAMEEKNVADIRKTNAEALYKEVEASNLPAESRAKVYAMISAGKHDEARAFVANETAKTIAPESQAQIGLLEAQTEETWAKADESTARTEHTNEQTRGLKITNDLAEEYGWQEKEAAIAKLDSEAALHSATAELRRKEAETAGLDQQKLTDMQKNAQDLMPKVREEALKMGRDALANLSPEQRTEITDAVDLYMADAPKGVSRDMVELAVLQQAGLAPSDATVLSEAMLRSANLSRDDQTMMAYTEQYAKQYAELAQLNIFRAAPPEGMSDEQVMQAIARGEKDKKTGRPYAYPDQYLEVVARDATLSAISTYQSTQGVGFGRQLGVATGGNTGPGGGLGATLTGIVDSTKQRMGAGG